jgi:hypothetical protein
MDASKIAFYRVYVVAGPGAYANGGRNTLALNHPQFVPGFTDRVDNPTVLNNGAVDRNFLTPGNPLFNNPEAVFSSSPRNIQVSAKLFF